jgi:hypothetical protein
LTTRGLRSVTEVDTALRLTPSRVFPGGNLPKGLSKTLERRSKRYGKSYFPNKRKEFLG